MRWLPKLQGFRLLRMFAVWGETVCPYVTQAQAQPFPWAKLFPARVSLKRLDAHKLVILNNRETTAP